ncbi:MAG: hypothetical protein LBS50_08130 [Prevotellaceae bacterium]|jgi:hypothetical protein|nr:hypothetical protein [Prevotellaceae bacterium]
MTEKIEFYEKQKLPVWLSIVFLAIVFFGEIYLYFHTAHYLSNKVYIRWAVYAFCELLFIFQNLKTIINKDGIFVNYFSIIVKKGDFFAWENIEKAYLRKYSPLGEYGGWGVRVKLFSLKMFKIFGFKKSFLNETAYVINGKTGLQLELKNGKRILISTQKPVEIQEVINLYKSV